MLEYHWDVGKVYTFYLSREYTCLIPGLEHMTRYIIPIHAEQTGMIHTYPPKEGEYGNTYPLPEGKYFYTHPESASLRGEYRNTSPRVEGKYFHTHPD